MKRTLTITAAWIASCVLLGLITKVAVRLFLLGWSVIK